MAVSRGKDKIGTVTKVEVSQIEVTHDLRDFTIEIETYKTVYGATKTVFWLKYRNFLIAYKAHEEDGILTDEQIQQMVKENLKYWVDSFGELSGTL